MVAADGALVRMEVKDRIGVLTLDNPEKRNALNKQLLDGLIAALADFEKQKVPVVIIRAHNGCSTWSAGHDMRELPRGRRDPLGYDDPLERALRAIQKYPGPVIALVQGGVWGGACDLVLTCDLVVGDPTCGFAITPVKIGLPYNPSGVLHFVNRLGLNIAKEMFFAADPVTADRAERIGILNHLVPSVEIEGFTMDMARKIASRSSLAVAVIKEQFRLLSGAYPLSPDTFERIQGLRRRIYDSHDYVEGIQAFLEKRPPAFTGE